MRRNNVPCHSERRRGIYIVVLTLTLGCLLSPSAYAQEVVDKNVLQFPPNEYFRATVIQVLEDGDGDRVVMSDIVQQVRLRIESGTEKGLEVTAQNALLANKQEGLLLNVGDHVAGIKSYGIDGKAYSAIDHLRVSPLLWIFFFLFVLVAFFGRIRGVMSLFGLLVSIAIIALFIVPQILQGRDPLLVSVDGSLGILCISLYLAHGFKKQTTVALISTGITLFISAGIAVLFVGIAHMFGSGSEEAIYLQFGITEGINLKGLFLGGVIIGTLGVLDDITTVQIATIKELKEANTFFSFKELYQRGIVIGREHIASLVNTLALAYTGASLPILLLFTVYNNQPLWMIVNSETISEEIIRTLVGSVALILAVPISTLCAAYYFSRTKPKH